MKTPKQRFTLQGYDPRVPLRENINEIKKVIKWGAPVFVGWLASLLANAGLVVDVMIITLVASLVKAYTLDLLDFYVGGTADVEDDRTS